MCLRAKNKVKKKKRKKRKRKKEREGRRKGEQNKEWREEDKGARVRNISAWDHESDKVFQKLKKLTKIKDQGLTVMTHSDHINTYDYTMRNILKYGSREQYLI